MSSLESVIDWYTQGAYTARAKYTIESTIKRTWVHRGENPYPESEEKYINLKLVDWMSLPVEEQCQNTKLIKETDYESLQQDLYEASEEGSFGESPSQDGSSGEQYRSI